MIEESCPSLERSGPLLSDGDWGVRLGPGHSGRKTSYQASYRVVEQS